MESGTSANKRIARNTASLYVRTTLSLFVGLYSSRIVLQVLGVSDFGIYNVVAGFVSLFAFLNATLATSLQRFYCYEGEVSGNEGYTRVFSLGVRIHLVLTVVVLLLLETFGLWYINHVMVIPAGRLGAARCIFHMSAASMALFIMQIPFTAAIIAREHIRYFATISIIDTLLKLAIALTLPYIGTDKLIAYGALWLGVSVFDFMASAIYSRVRFPYLRLTQTVEGHLLRQITSFSLWNLAGTFVYMFKGQGINLILNAFFGTIVNAARGIAYQVNSAVMGFSSNITMSFEPQIVTSLAGQNAERTKRLFYAESKICFALVLFIIAPAIVEMDTLLHLWLGSTVPDHAGLFCSLVLTDSLICTLNTPVTHVAFATGHIRRYQIYSCSLNILLLPVCWLWLKQGGEPWSVFVIAIAFTVINQCFCIDALRRIFPLRVVEYLRDVIAPCLLATVALFSVPLLVSLLMPDSTLRLVIVVLASATAGPALIYALLLTADERAHVRNVVSRHIKHKSAEN